MEKDNKYYEIIKNIVKNHRKYYGYEAILEDIIDDINTADEETLSRMLTLYEGRTRYDAPDIDCSVYFTSKNWEYPPGEVVKVLITDTYEYDLEGVEAEQ